MTISIKSKIKYRILVKYVKYKIEIYIRPNKTLRTTPYHCSSLSQLYFQKDEFYLCLIILHKLYPMTKKNTEVNQLYKLYL